MYERTVGLPRSAPGGAQYADGAQCGGACGAASGSSLLGRPGAAQNPTLPAIPFSPGGAKAECTVHRCLVHACSESPAGLPGGSYCLLVGHWD